MVFYAWSSYINALALWSASSSLPLSVRPVSYPENHYSMSPAGGDKVLPYRNPSASFSSPSSGLVGLASMGPPGITPGPFVRYKPTPDRCVCCIKSSPLCRDKLNQRSRVTTDCLNESYCSALLLPSAKCWMQRCLLTCRQTSTNSRFQRNESVIWAAHPLCVIVNSKSHLL